MQLPAIPYRHSANKKTRERFPIRHAVIRQKNIVFQQPLDFIAQNVNLACAK